MLNWADENNLNTEVHMNSPTPGVIRTLLPHQVFVFGSNESGRHGRGAALTAKQWGARNGQGFGLMGQTFGIPTKDGNMKTLSLGKIRTYVEGFIAHAIANPTKEFLVTRIGCGLAGLTAEQIAPMFFTARYMTNVHLSQDFIDVLQMHQNSEHA
jgi:hypothetical protein